MNRFRKTGTYLKIDSNFGENAATGLGAGAFSSVLGGEGAGLGLFDDEQNDYGNYGNEDDYEGDESEPLIDIDGDLAR
jgi:hypothetical protein